MITAPTQTQKEKSKLTKEEWREYTKTVWRIANTTDPDHPAVFPAEIPRRLIKLFSFYGETILDTFAGMATTALVAVELGRRCICVEQNPSYVRQIQKRCAFASNGDKPIRVLHGDSRRLRELASNSVALVVTSPPYWNKADYGKRKENLG